MCTLACVALLSAATPVFAPKVRPYDAQHYTLEVRLLEEGAFRNTLTATLKALRPLPSIELDAYGLTIEFVLVNGEAADFRLKYEPSLKQGTMTIKPKKPISAGKTATVEIRYTGTAGVGHEGFFSASSSDAPSALPGFFTHFEPSHAQRFLPCNDQPADKATTEVIATVDSRYTVLSNGTKASDEAFTENGRSLRRVRWVQEKPHSVYLLALAIGVYEAVPVPGLPLATIWVPPGTRPRAHVAADALKSLHDFQASFVGVAYPWDKLDVVSVPRFYWFGMENTSLIFERESELLLDHLNDQTARQEIVWLLAHELAHQWFGNFVTLQWWNDTWLNEGFATYLGSLAADEVGANDSMEIRRAARLVTHYFRQESGPRSHPLVVKAGAAPEQAFDSISYVKGANVLRMLELWIGRPAMQKVLKTYLERHAFRSASSDDFFKVVFDVTRRGKELRAFKEAWLTRRGFPIVEPTFTYADGSVRLTIRQRPSVAGEKPFVFKLPLVIHRTAEPAFAREEVIVVDKAEVAVTVEVPAPPEWVNWNMDFGALVKVDAASVPEEQWAHAARRDPDPVWRLLATWNLMGELGNPLAVEEALPSSVAMAALLEVLRQDPSPYVREAVLQRLARSRLRRLPSALTDAAEALARRPVGLTEDPAGFIRVKSAALEVLGKCESPEGHRYLLEELAKKELDINSLAGVAAGVARIDTPAALATLRAALVTHRPRGSPYFLRVAHALGSVESVEVASLLRGVLKEHQGNGELVRGVFERLNDNQQLKSSEEYAEVVRETVLDEAGVTEELRSDVLETLDDVKTESAKQALETIVTRSTSERIKLVARQTLKANFAVPGETPRAQPAPSK